MQATNPPVVVDGVTIDSVAGVIEVPASQRTLPLALVGSSTPFAATVNYLGAGNASPTEAHEQVYVTRPGTVRALHLTVDEGAATTGTYTLRLNGADTAATWTGPGGAITKHTLTGLAIALAAGDLVCASGVRVSGANSVQVRSVVLEVEYD